MAQPVLTRQMAWAAATDAGNRSMRKHGRANWDEDDWNAATEEFNRLWREDGGASMSNPAGVYSSRLFNEKNLLTIPTPTQITDTGKKGEYEKIAVSWARKFGVDAWRLKSAKYGGAAWVSDSGLKVIDAPQPDTINGLYTWLHESAHHHYEHVNRDEPYHREEMQADTKALEIMRAHGIEIPKKILVETRWNICQAAARDEKQKVRIDADVVRYCEGVRL